MLYDRIPYRLIKERPKGYTVVGAMDTPVKLRAGADYICTGTRTTGGDQNTINTALQEGKAVLLLPGTYWLSGSILPDSNQMLVGSGMSTVLKLRDNHNTNVDLIYVYGKSGVIIKDLVIDGNKVNQTSGNVRGIFLNNASNCRIIKCNVLNNSFMGMYLYNNTNDSMVINCIVENNGMYNIIVHSGSSRNKIVNNITRNGTFGIVIQGSCEHNMVCGNHVISNASEGIYIVYTSNNNIIYGNICIGNGGVANIIIRIASSYNLVLGNVCRHNNASNRGIAVHTSDCVNNIIHGNDLYSSGLSGDIYDAGTNTRRRDNIGNDGNWLTDA